MPVRLVLLQMPGPGGGGGGGGNRQVAPPSRARGIGRDRMTVPVAPAIVESAHPTESPLPPQRLALDVLPLASGDTVQPGLPDAPESLPFSQGPGTGGGVGSGTGSGIGPGAGPGLGPGTGGGFGGGAYRVGGGVTSPTLLVQVRPTYTPEALARKIQGTVTLEVVVTRDGTPGAMRVVRSLDPGGLDEASMDAVRKWRFTPGRIGGAAVDVLVTIVVDFHIT